MSSFFEKIYYKLPVFFQNWAITLFGLYWYRRRFGGIFKTELEACKKREFYSKEQWDTYQVQLLRNVLLHAFDTVPYYKNLFSEHKITRSFLAGIELNDLPNLPILEKDIFRKLGGTELLSDKPEPDGAYYYSSGSTGTPTKTLYSLRMHQSYYSVFEARINNWAGIDYKVPRGVIGGRRIIRDGVGKAPFYRYNYVEKQTYFSAYHLSKDTVSNYLEGMIKHKVEYMTGYAMSNYFLARFIEEAGLKAPKLRAVLTSSEKLTKEMRDTFRRVYGCETYDSYNGVEATCLVSECEHGRLHIVPDVGIVEVLNEQGKACGPGEQGEVVTTGLLNFDQPLIRYRMGDIIKLSQDQSCPCGRHMPLVDEIIGRVEDVVVGPDGREMVRFHGIFVKIPAIVEAQVIQYTLYDFEIKLVTSSDINISDLHLIEKRMYSQLGDIQLKINIVDSIPRSANGKFKAVISHVKR